MLNYQRRLYESYHSTHVQRRKGADDTSSLRTRSAMWDRVWGPLLPKDTSVRILDGACGNGAMVGWLHGRGFANAEGVDISAEVIDEGHRLGIAGLRTGDFREVIRQGLGEYDVLILRDVLEHFAKEETLHVLEEVRMALKPDGRLLLHVPNGDSPMFGRVRYGDFTHETAFTGSSLTQVLLATGYEAPLVLSSPPVATSLRSKPRVAMFSIVQQVYRLLAWTETGKWPSVVTQNLLCVAERRD